ncbi:bactofilin family protein [Anaerosinus massiliensis]|uniref:bactofilin family protein n=1 Tax=Massilibacillus massiliensis TaxID=1806837 RepID=UPI000AA55AE9|nr:polymer-forming cytoskeletal protein [Massilibacillus massiliensis]
MFSSKKKTSGLSTNEIETIIGKNTKFKGTISGEGNVRIDGALDGEISSTGDIVIGEQGNVTATIKANNVLISGTVKGNIHVNSKLEITATGNLFGDVRASVLSIAEGAAFKGSSNMEASEVAVKEEKLAKAK